MVCGYEVRTSCEVSPSLVTPDSTASIITVEAVILQIYYYRLCVILLCVFMFIIKLRIEHNYRHKNGNAHLLYVGLFRV